MSGKTLQQSTSSKIWIPIIVAVISLIGLIMIPVLNNSPYRQIGSENSYYRVRIETETGDPIANANVTIELSGMTPLSAVSDANGSALVLIDSPYAGNPARLFVEATGYQPFSKHVDLTRSTLPTIVLLKTIAATAPETPFPSNTKLPIPTTNPTLTLQAAYNEIDQQFQNLLKANIAFNKPESMNLDETATVEFLLNPALSQSELATQVVMRGELATSTAEPAVLIAPGGGNVQVVTSEIEITDRMKAVLVSQDSQAFDIQAMHDNPEQIISTVDTTVWRWAVTARAEGNKTLELVVYRLIKYADKDYWREVETYRANINVKVTPLQRLKDFDWKWFAGILVTLLLIPFFWRWYDARKKQPASEAKLDEEKKSPREKPPKPVVANKQDEKSTAKVQPKKQ